VVKRDEGRALGCEVLEQLVVQDLVHLREVGFVNRDAHPGRYRALEVDGLLQTHPRTTGGQK
jgi:hypothetical protein